MPFVEPSTESDLPSRSAINEAFNPLASELARDDGIKREESAGDLLKYAVPSAVAGFADTFLTSLGIADENTVSESLMNINENLGLFYRRNQDASETVGSLAGMFIPGTIAVKAFTTGSNILRGVNFGRRATPIIESLLINKGKADRLLNAIRERDKLLASTGTTDFLKDQMRRSLVNKLRITKAGDIVKETAAFELGVAATMNESQTLYSDEFTMAENIALNSVFPGVFAGAAVSQVNRAVRASAQSVANDAIKALNPEAFPVNLTAPREGTRDYVITVDALTASAARQASREYTGEEAALARQNFNATDLTLMNEAKGQIERLQRDSIFSDGAVGKKLTTGFTPNDKITANAVNLIREEPTSLLGTISIEQLPKQSDLALRGEHKKANVKLFQKRIDDLRKEFKDGDIPIEKARELDLLRARKELIESSQEFVLESDGSLVLAQGRKALFQDQDNWLKRIKVLPRNETYDRRFRTEVGKRAIQFSDTGVLTISGRGEGHVGGLPLTGKKDPLSNFSELNYRERSAAYASMQKAINSWDGKTRFGISFNDHHTKLDYVIGLHEKHGDKVLDNIRLPSNMSTIDDIKFASLNSKFPEYSQLRDLVNERAGRLNIDENKILSIQDIGRMLNLPVSLDGDISPVLKMFEDLYQEQGIMDIASRFVTFGNLKRLAQDSTTFPEVLGFLNRDLAATGGMTAFREDWAPALILKKPVSENLFSRQGFINEAIVQRSIILKELNEASNHGADFVQLVTDRLNGLNATRVAQQTDTVVEGMQRGRGIVGQQSFAAGENPAVQAAKTVELETDKPFRLAVAKTYEQLPSGLRPNQIFAALRSPSNIGDLESFNLFAHARRQAWDLEADVINENGKYFYKLDPKSRHNQDLWKRHFGEEMPDDALMPAPTNLKSNGYHDYTPLAVTENAKQAVDAISEIDALVRLNTNHLKRVAGQAPINFKNHHIPPKNFAGQETGFLVTKTGELHSVVAGRSAREMQKIADQEIAASEGNLIFVSRKDTEKYFSLKDQAFERMLDLSDPLNQKGRATGKSVGQIIETGPGVLDDIINSQQRQFESILRRSRAAYFEPQIRHIKKLMQISQPEALRQGQSIYNQYLNSLFGNPTLNPNDIVGRTYMTAESIFDDILTAAFDKAVGAKTAAIGQGTRETEKRFGALEKQLGEFNPFQNAVDFAQNTHDIKLPVRLKPVLGKLNSVTTALTLRLFEVGHSVLTMASLGATIPAVVNSMRRHAFETSEQHAARIGAFGVKVADDHAMFSANRAIITTIHDMFNDKTMQGIWRKAADAGYMDQQVAEIYRTLVAPKAGYAENLAHRATEVLSFLTDKSEKAARGLSFMIGYNVARKAIGIQDDLNRFAFANHFANQVIGDYSPNNRPRIFQGAVGMPLGLFQTFTWNFYQRLFSYIENKDVRSLVTQYATQAAVFGGETVPGFYQFSEMFGQNYDGTANIIDGMESRFGRNTTEWFLDGTLSNLPKMFGADTGVSLYTRGDINIRNAPGLTPPAAVQFVGNTLEGIGEVIKGFREGGMSDQRIAEIVANYGTNRFMRNMGYIYNAAVNDAPQVVDRRGGVINKDVFDEMSLIARSLSLRPLDETRNMALMRRIRNTELSRRARQGDLRKNLRSSIRQGTLREDLPNFVRNYLKYGGSPDGVADVLLNNAMAALVDKTQLETFEVLNSTTRGFDALRLLRALDAQQAE